MHSGKFPNCLIRLINAKLNNSNYQLLFMVYETDMKTLFVFYETDTKFNLQDILGMSLTSQ